MIMFIIKKNIPHENNESKLFIINNVMYKTYKIFSKRNVGHWLNWLIHITSKSKN